MLRFPVNKAVVTIDIEHPSVGMGHGAIEMKNGSTSLTLPFQVISEDPVELSADELLAAAKTALMEENIALSPVRVLRAS